MTNGSKLQNKIDNNTASNIVKGRIDELVKLINKHDHLYHTMDSPEISDEIYDGLVKELIELEDKYPEYKNKNSPSQKIGDSILSGFEKINHKNKQYSFDKIFNFTELQDWENKNNKILNKNNSIINYNYICELKIDGLKLIITYKSGKLETIATRGDGKIGEDITLSAKYIKDIPKTLKESIDITVIGECWLSKDNFEKINKELEKENKEIYANPRNLAAGTIRNLDTSIIKNRELSFFAYSIDGDINNQNNIQNKLDRLSQEDDLLYLKKLGFVINKEYKVVNNIKEVQDIYNYWDKNRGYQQYSIDGLVIKINDNNVYYSLGWTNKSPRAAVAYKFTAEEAISVIENIICQVGRTGAVTPVAILKPTEVAGSVVSRATLHNKDEIERLGIYIGDTVIIEKAGDIIPKIKSVMIDLRNKNQSKYIFPSSCPECHQKLITKDNNNNNGVISYCPNVNCLSRLVESLIHFASNKAMNIEGLGEKIIEEFYELKLINKHYHSIYKLKKEMIKDIFGFGEKSADNIINSINNSKDVELANFIYALGIIHIGESTARDLANYYKNINNLLATNSEELLSINNIGEETAKELLLYINNKDNREEINILNKILNIKHTSILVKENKNINNKTIVITGSLSQSRDYFKNIIIINGGYVTESVSKNTDYLLCGADAGSKLEKAKKLNIKIINEEEFKKLF